MTIGNMKERKMKSPSDKQIEFANAIANNLTLTSRILPPLSVA